MSDPQERLAAIRKSIEAEEVSYGEIAELQGLVAHIDPSDVVLLQWAGVPESPEDEVMSVYLHYGNAQTGAVGGAGPFDWVQVTYNTVVRVNDDEEVATFTDGLWYADGHQWTDLTVSTTPVTEWTPICDICDEPEYEGEADWNGETGNHLSCEAEVRAMRGRA